MFTLLKSIKEQLSTLSVSDSYKGDWYGYASNQLSHTFLGFLVTCSIGVFGYYYLNEFMHKETIWLIISSGYILFEWVTQGFKKPLDTIEDWLFFSVYGSGGPVLLFTEKQVGSPFLEVSVLSIGPILAIMFTHLLTGIVVRIIEKNRQQAHAAKNQEPKQ